MPKLARVNKVSPLAKLRPKMKPLPPPTKDDKARWAKMAENKQVLFEISIPIQDVETMKAAQLAVGKALLTKKLHKTMDKLGLVLTIGVKEFE